MGVLEKGVRPVPPEQDDWLKRGKTRMKWSPFSSLFHPLGGASAVSFFAGVRIDEEEEEEEEKMKEHLSYSTPHKAKFSLTRIVCLFPFF